MEPTPTSTTSLLPGPPIHSTLLWQTIQTAPAQSIDNRFALLLWSMPSSYANAFQRQTMQIQEWLCNKLFHGYKQRVYRNCCQQILRTFSLHNCFINSQQCSNEKHQSIKIIVTEYLCFFKGSGDATTDLQNIRLVWSLCIRSIDAKSGIPEQRIRNASKPWNASINGGYTPCFRVSKAKSRSSSSVASRSNLYNQHQNHANSRTRPAKHKFMEWRPITPNCHRVRSFG